MASPVSPASPATPANPSPRATRTPEERARLAERYPAARRTPRTLVVLAMVLVVGLVGWILWAGLHHSRPETTAQVFSFKAINDTRTDAVLLVHRPDPSRASSCTVKAQALSGEVVGTLETPVPAGGPAEVRVPITVKTFLPATTVWVDHCTEH